MRIKQHPILREAKTSIRKQHQKAVSESTLVASGTQGFWSLVTHYPGHQKRDSSEVHGHRLAHATAKRVAKEPMGLLQLPDSPSILTVLPNSGLVEHSEYTSEEKGWAQQQGVTKTDGRLVGSSRQAPHTTQSPWGISSLSNPSKHHLGFD